MILGGGLWHGESGSGDYAAFAFSWLLLLSTCFSLYYILSCMYQPCMTSISALLEYPMHSLDQGGQCSHVSALVECGSE